LTLRATTLPVVLAAHIAPDAQGIEIDGDAKVSRAAFGLTGTLRLGSDEVTVSLHLRVVPVGDPANAARQ
jgi:polyisoprenoid-binding protein YceI